MISRPLLLAAGGALALPLTALTGTAAAQDAGFAPSSYVQVGLGLSFVTDDAAIATGVDFEGKTFRDDGVLDYGVGAAFGGVYGYQALPALAVEAELSARVNDFDDNLGDPLTVTSFLANVVLSPPRARNVVPYVGAGLGFSSTNIEESGIAFTYQAKAGAKLPVGARGLVGVEAAYLRTDGFDSSFRDEFGDPGTFDIEYAGVSVMATYTFLLSY